MYPHPEPVDPEEVVGNIRKNKSVVNLLFSHMDSTACHQLGIHITKEELKEMLDKGYKSFEQKLSKKELKVLGSGVYGAVYASKSPITLGEDYFGPTEFVIKKYRTISADSIRADPSLSLKKIVEIFFPHVDVGVLKSLNDIDDVNGPIEKRRLLVPSDLDAFTPCLVGRDRAKFLNSTQIRGTLSNKLLKFSPKDYICGDDFPVEAMIGSYVTQVIKSPFFVSALSFTVCYSGKNSKINRFMFLERANGILDGIKLKNEKEILDVIFMIFFALAQFQEHGFNHMDLKLDNIFYKDLPSVTDIGNLKLKGVRGKWKILTDRLVMIGDYGLSCRYLPHRIGLDYSFMNDFSSYFPEVVPNEFSSSYDVLFFLNNMYYSYPKSKSVQTLLSMVLGTDNFEDILDEDFIGGRPKHYVTRNCDLKKSADPKILLSSSGLFEEYRD